MIKLLADSLRHAGIDFTTTDVSDILWLASRLPLAPASELAGDASVEPPSDDLETGDVGNAAASLDPAPPQQDTLPPEDACGTPMYSGDTMQGILNAGVLRAPGVAGTPGPAALRRTLQPFIRRIASRREHVLDEEAMANSAAESGMWTPVFRPVRERRFELSLVIEDCTSGALHARALSELAENLRDHAGLRSLRRYHWGGSAKAQLMTENGDELGLEQLLRGDHRHLVLFATDGTSSRWRDGSAQAFLHTVGGSTSVTLLHLLPRDAWKHTLIGEPDVTLFAGLAGEANSHMQYRLPRWLDPDDVRACLPVPVIDMRADSMAAWARVMCALGGASTQGVMIAPPSSEYREIPPVPPAPAPEPAERVARYRQMATPSAFDLAVFLSTIDPLTIPVMRLIQRTMAPDTGDGELAEFILGGLVIPGAPTGAGGEEMYRFRNGVRAELTRALLYSEENSIRRQLMQVGRFLENAGQQDAAFASSFPSPAGKFRLTEWALPFAQVSRDAIKRFADPAPVIDLDSDPSTQLIPSASLRTRLRILHLSDLHMGTGRDRASRRVRVELGAPWTEALRAIAVQGQVDLVCVSGDLTWSALPEQFDAAGAFLDATLEALSLPRTRLFVVPGNHDLLRQRGKSSTSSSPRRRESQESYREWIGAYLPHLKVGRDAASSDFGASLDGWTMPLRIVGLDSSWMTYSPAGASELIIAQFDRHKARSKSGFVVVLSHHSPSAINAIDNSVRIDGALAAAGVGLLMHGHERPGVPTLNLGPSMARSA
ncbi:MAG: SAV_2336 N-terminal domain-related protein, partial [Massilia sp.]